MYCDKCGYNNNNTATHCLGCGASLKCDVDNNSSKKKIKASGVNKICLTLSVVMILIGLLQMSCIFRTYLAQYGWKGYKKVEGVIVGNPYDPYRYDNNKVYFSFNYNGRDYYYEAYVTGYNYHYIEGTAVDLYFNPKDPDSIVEIKSEQAEAVNMNIAKVGLVIFIIGCILLIKPIKEIIALLKQNQKRHKILTTGYGIRCVVKDVTREYAKGSNLVGSKIICTDMATGRIYESALIKQDLMWVMPGMEVGVMVDRSNPDDYWVLTPKPNVFIPYM